MPDHVDAAPPGPAHELRQLASGQGREVDAVEFGEGRDDDPAGRHVDAQRQRFGGEHDLDQPTLEQLLHHLLVVGEKAGVVLSQAATQQASVDHAAEKGLFVLVLQSLQALRRDAVDGLLLRRRREVELVVRAPLQRLAAAPPRKDEVDRGQHVESAQLFDHMQEVVGGQPLVPADPIGRLFLLGRLAPGPLVDAAVFLEERGEAVVDRKPHLQLDRADVVEHGLHAAAVLRHPVRDLLVVADRRRQADELDRRRRLDDDLLPDRAAREVVDVVHLVEHHKADEVEATRVFVDEVAQNLGGHHDDGGVVVDRVLAGDKADHLFAVCADEIVVLLVAQRLQRRRVEDFRAVSERSEDCVLGDDGLAAGGGSADQDPAGSPLELVDRLALKRVEAERQRLLELVDE